MFSKAMLQGRTQPDQSWFILKPRHHLHTTFQAHGEPVKCQVLVLTMPLHLSAGPEGKTGLGRTNPNCTEGKGLKNRVQRDKPWSTEHNFGAT